MATSTVFADLASEEVNTRANVIENEAALTLDQCIAIAMENSPDIAQKSGMKRLLWQVRGLPELSYVR